MLITGLGVGFSARREMERRLSALSLLERFIGRLAVQMRVTAQPIGEVLRELSHTAEFAALPLVAEVAEGVTDSGEFRTAWRQAVARYSREWRLSEQETALLSEFAEGLGTADMDGEEKHCEQYRRLMADCVTGRREETRTRGRLYVALSACGSFAAVLLLV